MHGATGETGVVPDSGSHVEKDGYHAERFSASLKSSFVSDKLFHSQLILLPSGSAPEDRSPNSSLRLSRTSERRPAVLGVAKTSLTSNGIRLCHRGWVELGPVGCNVWIRTAHGFLLVVVLFGVTEIPMLHGGPAVESWIAGEGELSAAPV